MWSFPVICDVPGALAERLQRVTDREVNVRQTTLPGFLGMLAVSEMNLQRLTIRGECRFHRSDRPVPRLEVTRNG